MKGGKGRSEVTQDDRQGKEEGQVREEIGEDN